MAPLILGMNAAFGLLEAGSVQNKNVLNIMMKNLGDLVLGGVAWYLIGYRIAFTHESSRWPQFVADESLWVFQWSFAATAATIDSGALAERVNFLAYCFLSFFMTAVIYPVVVSWVWNAEGWLFKLGFVDFAGSAVVHMLGGVSALVSTAMLGPRIGRFTRYKPMDNRVAQCLLRRPLDPDYYAPIPGRPPIVPITDAVSAVWGVFFLWIGWYGFNPGGVTNVESYQGAFSVGRIAVNTTMGAIGGGMIGFLRRAYRPPYKVVPEDLCTGVLCGLVAVTAGCLNLDSGCCFLLGCFAAVLGFLVKYALERAYIDDVVSAIPVHGACGFFGTVMVGFLAVPNSCSGGPVGVFFAKNAEESREAWHLVGVQVLGCLAIAAWSVVTTFVTVVVLNQFELLRFRLPRHIEVLGIDEHEHDMPKDLMYFLEVLKNLVHALSQSSPDPESVREAAVAAGQCITFPAVMARQRRDELEKMQGLLLRITDLRLSGAGLQASLYCMSQIVVVEAMSGDQEPDDKRCFWEFYAPRWTHGALGPVAAWADELAFPDFYVPPLTEDLMRVHFAVASSTKGSEKSLLGTAQAPFKELHWEGRKGDAELVASIDVPVTLAGPGSQVAAGARLTATAVLSVDGRRSLRRVLPSLKRSSVVRRLLARSSGAEDAEEPPASGPREDVSGDFADEGLGSSSLQQFIMGGAARRGGGRGDDLLKSIAALNKQVADFAQLVAVTAPQPGTRGLEELPKMPAVESSESTVVFSGSDKWEHQIA